ncbi:MAG TPA: type VI secretion system tube protein Hcp [Casimicrobiaceae bacterium]
MPNLEIFLKLDGIDGESTVKGHEKEIDVLSYEQSLDSSVIHSGDGGGSHAGRSKFAGVRLRKNVDAASIPVLLACATGHNISEARFTFRRGAGRFEFYKVTLEQVLVTHVAQRAGTGVQYPLSFDALNAGSSNDGFIDEVTLDFSRIRWEYRVQRPDGAIGTTMTGGWDVAANKKL